MSDDVEMTFAALPVEIRMPIISALQDRVILLSNGDLRDEAADALTRLGYPGTAESALRVRATLDAL